MIFFIVIIIVFFVGTEGYRNVVGGDDVKEELIFDIDNLEGISGEVVMITEEKMYDRLTEEIIIVITNNESRDCSVDLYYTIEHFVDGLWEPVLLDFYVDDLTVILNQGVSKNFTVYLYNDQYDYRPGMYRICKTVLYDSSNSVELVAEFEILD